MSKKKIEPKIWIRGAVEFLGILLILTCFYTLWNAEYLGGKHFLQNFPGNFIAYGRYYWKAILLVSILIFATVCLVRKIFSMENGRKKEWMIRLVFFLVLLVSIGVVFQDFLLGNRYYIFGDIGSDTYQQYYPYYLNCVNRIREGSFSIWNWNYGMGTSLLNNISQTLDPFGLFIIFGGVLLGAEKVKYLLLAAQVLKIIIAALLGRSFLKILTKKPRRILTKKSIKQMKPIMPITKHFCLLLPVTTCSCPVLLSELSTPVSSLKTKFIIGLTLMNSVQRRTG